VPVRITSGYRCPEHNASVGGAGKSQHTIGTAVDIAISGLNIGRMYELALQVPEFASGGIGVYHDGHIHLDVRGEPARWGVVNGEYISIATFFDPSATFAG